MEIYIIAGLGAWAILSTYKWFTHYRHNVALELMLLGIIEEKVSIQLMQAHMQADEEDDDEEVVH